MDNTDAEPVIIDGVEVMLGDWASSAVRDALQSRSYERAERNVLATTLSQDDTYLELGCGIGLLATQAAARVGDGRVVAIEADPVIATVARETASRNGHRIDVRNAVLVKDPSEPVVDFYVRPDFRVSSLSPLPPEGSRRIQVHTVDAIPTIAGVEATYLMVDIEGAETDLLRLPLPNCVKTVCVDLHAEATGIDAQSEMMAALFAQGFDLDIGNSDLPALLFRRK